MCLHVVMSMHIVCPAILQLYRCASDNPLELVGMQEKYESVFGLLAAHLTVG